jgi:membrane protein
MVEPPEQLATASDRNERPAARPDLAAGTADKAEPGARFAPIGRLVDRIGQLPAVRRLSSILDIYNRAGGSLLAEGLAYSALFAGLTGLLFAVGLLGYLVPDEVGREELVGFLTGQLAALAPVARDGLRNVASHGGAFSIIGLAGLAWGTSHFYGALDAAIARVFARRPARGPFDRILRGFVSVFLLVGGLLSGIGLSAIKATVTSRLEGSSIGAAAAILADVAFPLLAAFLVIVAVGIVYRVVPNTTVPLQVLWLPTLVAGLALTGLTELLVYIAPILTGALSVFGGVAAVFAALAWLHLAFQVLLIGASWTRLRLDEAGDD